MHDNDVIIALPYYSTLIIKFSLFMRINSHPEMFSSFQSPITIRFS